MSDFRALYHQSNERYGLTCYVSGENPYVWSLWRDQNAEAGLQKTLLVSRGNLGPDGMIWVIWEARETDERGQPVEMMIVIEYCDDSATPSVSRSGLMHLPSGSETGLIFDYGSISLEEGDDVLFAACSLEGSEMGSTGYALYDRNLRKAFSATVGCILRRPRKGQVKVLVRLEDGVLRECLHNYVNKRDVIPAQYDNVYGIQNLRYCNTDDDRCDVRDLGANGKIITSFDYQVIEVMGRLYVQKNGLFGWADEFGQMIGQPFAESLDAMEALPVEVNYLNVDTAVVDSFVFASGCLKLLVSEVGQDGYSIKYEGIPGAGDGYIDVQLMILPDDGNAFLITDRYGPHPVLLIILIANWRELVAGTVMAWDGNFEAKPITIGSPEGMFLAFLVGHFLNYSL